MATTVRQDEAQPATWPAFPFGLSASASYLDPGPLWARIESHIAFRYTARTVVWTVEGLDDWTPPLAPATITLAERWTGSAWLTVTLAAGPYGYTFDDPGPHRITATVGGGAVPRTLNEAYRRLAEYVAASDGSKPGVSDYSVNLGGGDLSQSWQRNPAHLARALVNSGAADLLRPYRRL